MMRRKRLGDLLVESNMLSPEDLTKALQLKTPDEKLGDYLIKEELITEQQLIEVLELQLGIPHVHLSQYTVEPEVTQLVPKELAKQYTVMPIRKEKNRLFVAMADPMDFFAIEELRMATGCSIETSIATKDELLRTITKHYDIQESMNEAMNSYQQGPDVEDADLTDEDSPMVRLVNQIIGSAVNQRASDIHFDPQETDVQVRYRIDGVLRAERALPKNIQNVITARIKIMANLNITESRMPQDGRIKTTINFRPVDIRVSTLPTIFGEKVVMRVLDLSSSLNDLKNLAFSEENVALFQKMIKKPNGIVLITGPTGSGKSSTLYSALNELNSSEVNIITVEDPVEYQLDRINQIQVNEEIGLTFASGLRSILRQDPDIIMIGEIRDVETAQIAIRASLTGHLVFSTLHTNSAVDSISRINDMGVEPFLVASSLAGIVAQRLVRKVCRECGKEVEPNEREHEIFRERGLHISALRRGEGCAACDFTGYRGRLAIHEVLEVDDELKQLILQRAGASVLRAYARDSGMKTLLDDGLQKVLQGHTTTEEVLRVASLQ